MDSLQNRACDKLLMMTVMVSTENKFLSPLSPYPP